MEKREATLPAVHNLPTGALEHANPWPGERDGTGEEPRASRDVVNSRATEDNFRSAIQVSNERVWSYCRC
jgi:hypothetical protein